MYHFLEFISTKAILKLKFRGDCFLKNLNDCCDNTKEWEAEENAPSRNSDACRGFDGNENSMERTGNAFRAIISLSGKTSEIPRAQKMRSDQDHRTSFLKQSSF